MSAATSGPTPRVHDSPAPAWDATRPVASSPDHSMPGPFRAPAGPPTSPVPRPNAVPSPPARRRPAGPGPAAAGSPAVRRGAGAPPPRVTPRGAGPAPQGGTAGTPTGRRRPAGPTSRTKGGQPTRTGRRATPTARRPRPQRDARTRRRGRLAVVYDIDGPRVRLGVGWFLLALVGVFVSPITAALVYGVAAGWAARQVVRAWGSVAWQVDVAGGLGAVPVLAALGGTRLLIAALSVAVLVAIGAACAPGGERLAGRGGRAAALGILLLAIVPSAGAASMVLVRGDSRAAAVVLLLLVSAYEMGDFVVGSGASNSVEGPLAGITTALLVGLPLALMLVNPFDDAGAPLLAFAAAACPLGQIAASGLLPDAGASAPALRRIDTLLVLGPLWAAASAAF
jgi:hypothetical protein